MKQENKCGKYMTGFCIKCGRHTPFAIASDKVVLFRNDIVFDYDKLLAFCSICGTKGYIHDINDENVERRLTAYGQAKRSN